MRLIDADALHRKVKMETNPYGKPTIDYDSGVKVLEWIDKSPTIDAVEVVHGHWIIGVDNDDFDIKCSKCEWTDTFEVAGIAAVERIAKAMHYCLNCGARIDGGEE